MKRVTLQDMTVDQLVARFLAIALAQSDALDMENYAKFNRLFDQMTDLMAEFKMRSMDQRRALMSLYGHPNRQVRYTAAVATMEFALQAARQVFEIIVERNEYPQAADARGYLRQIDGKWPGQP